MSQKVTMREQILGSAQQFVQTGGFHAFSYADIAAAVGIQKASIHYYFPAKTDLGREMVARYREEFRQQCRRISLLTPDADGKLQQYAHLFRDMLRSGPDPESVRACLCGVLVSEWHGLSEGMQEEITGFFRENECWLADVMDAGRAGGCLRFDGPASLQAQAFLAGLEGAMQTARVCRDVTLYCTLAHRLLGQMGSNALSLDTLSLDALALEALPAARSRRLVSGSAR